MVKDGIMIFDDYGFDTCHGARQAVDEFFADKPEHAFYLPSGQCFVVRERGSKRRPAASRQARHLTGVPAQLQNV
jgi:hypothetical protein